MKELEKIAEEFKRSAEVIRELREKLEATEKKAQYWKDKYDKSLHDYLELEKAAEKCSGELMNLKERFAEVIAENHILKQSCFFGNDKRAHDIALESLKRQWKSGRVEADDGGESFAWYIAAYKYILKELEKELTP